MSKMTSSKAFGFAVAGSMGEDAAAAYDHQFNSFYSNIRSDVSEWLGNALTGVKESHDLFMRSRMWEFGKKLKGNDGYYVGRYEIGYLGGVEAQMGAEGFMRDIIMANPAMMSHYEAGRVSGFDDEISLFNRGMERENYFYNKVNNGYQDNNREHGGYTRYMTTRDNLTSYSTRERHDAHRTWRASNIHLEKGLDPSNILGGKLLSEEEGVKYLEKKAEAGAKSKEKE